MKNNYFSDRRLDCLGVIPTDSICYIKVVYDKVQIIRYNNNHSLTGTIESVLRKLLKDKFVQIHRQFAVSLDYINTVSRDGVTLTTAPDLFLPISRKYYPALMKRVKIVGVVVRKC